MPKYVIERDVPGIGNATQEEARTISQKSCVVLNKLGPTIQWLHSCRRWPEVGFEEIIH
ncbi:MAG: nickel-binding protein [Candidatus Sulfotelmatobacter sp.]